jgi:nitric oxide reductase activation protein
VYDTARASFHIYTIFFEHFPLVAYCNRSDVRELFAGSGKTSVFPEIIAETSPELFHTRKKQVQQEQLDTSEEQDVDLTSLSRSEKKARELRQALIQGSLAIYRHPEYNVFTAGYQKKYCTVFESYLESTDNDYYDSIIKAHRQLYRRIKKRFLFLQPEEVEITRKWLDGNDIHIADAVDYATDFMRGTFLDEKIYMRKKQNVRDIVAAIVTDASSSTDEKIGGKRIIDIEMTALSLLSSALSLIGDRFALFTFFSMGRQNVFFNIIKDFHEPWNNHTQARVSSVKAIAGNRDGAAIRHTVMKLLQQPEKTKLMILLSDGIPADTGYGTSDGAETNRYAIEDTRRAVIEARMQGVIPFCITIDRAAKKYIPHLYGDYHYAVLPDVMLLPEKLSRLYVKLTK